MLKISLHISDKHQYDLNEKEETSQMNIVEELSFWDNEDKETSLQEESGLWNNTDEKIPIQESDL
ncbi:2910_t:CDS:2 [Funneliformis geosporum]|nr:2910_t:CDS:2 [Funneliformis geosporum]